MVSSPTRSFNGSSPRSPVRPAIWSAGYATSTPPGWSTSPAAVTASSRTSAASATGPRRTDSKAVNAYQKLLEWEIVKQPTAMKLLERGLAPALGKSLIVYGRKPVAVGATA